MAILVGLTSFLSSSVNAQTVLAQGDIAFVQYDADNPDKFTFVTLVDLAAGTVINFTDCGFASATTGTTTEGFLTFTVPAGTTYSKGTTFTWTNGMVVTGTPWSSAAPTNFSFNASGDQLFAFQGSTLNWATQSGITLIAGLIQRTTWLTTGSAAAATSYQPSALSSAYITSLATENGYFANGTATSTSVVVSNTKAQLQSLLFDGTNKWYNNATGPLAAPTFSISLGSAPVITGAATASAFTTTYGTASTAQTFPISGSNLTANLVATAPTGFEVSADGTSYDGTATFTQSGGTASGSLRVRLKANAAVSGSYNAQNIVLSSTGATSVNIVTASTGNAVTAKGLTITANDQSVTVGSALSDVTNSTLFTASGLVNSETVGTVTLNFGGQGAAAGNFTGAITPSAAAGGTFTASNYSISYVAGTLTVSAAAVPTITSGSQTLPALSSTYGTASSSTSFTVSGADMKAGITVTAPTGFEVSTDDTTFSSSVTVGSSGSIGSTMVYVRLASSVSAGSKSGSIALSSTDATTINVPITTSTVSAKGVTGSFVAANKTYDGATSATVNSRSLTGVLGSDQVTLSGGTATFDTATAGTGKTVTLTGATLAGTAKDNYTLSSVATTTADITKANQTITFNSLSAANNDFSLSATANSGLPVSFTSSNLGVATVSGNQVTLVAAGTTTITATQAGNENYEAATSVTQELTVSSVPYRLVAGDIAVIGYNAVANNPDTITLLILKTLNAGTVFYVCDNEVATEGGTTFSDTTESEATFTVSAGQTIPAGTVVTLPWGNQTVTDSRFTWTGHTSGGLGASSGNFDDGIYIYTGTSATATPTAFIYFVKGGSNAANAGNLPAGLSYGTTAINPTAGLSRYKISGAVYVGPAETLLPAIGNTTNNWEAVAPGAVTDWSFDIKYLAPLISALSPSSVLPGGQGFTLTITGSNFYTTSQVTLAGVSKTVTYVNSGQLTIPVASEEIANAGNLTLVVTNPAPGGSASKTLAVNSGPSLALTPPADNSAFATTIQTATASRTFKVAGSNLTTGITLAPPTGFEISLDDVSFSTSILLPQTDGVVAETTLYLRFNPSALQSYSGSVTAATDGVTPSPSFAVLGNASVPPEGKLTGTFADGSATLNATAPATGTVTEYIVLAKVGSAITDVPSGDASSYSASATYGSGTKIGDSYVVYKGSTPPSAYQVTGLTNGVRYYFSMFSRVATAYSTPNSTNGFPAGTLSNVITQWNFNNNFNPSIGTGNFSFVGTITNATSASGSSTDSSSPNNAASTSGYPANATGGSGTSGVVFNVSTVGKQNIVIYWDVRHSGTSSRYLQFQYSTDGGVNWTNFNASSDSTENGLYVGNTTDTWFLQRKADLSTISAVNNNANFAFRIIAVFAPNTTTYVATSNGSASSYGTTGTLRYDMVTVTGTDAASLPYDATFSSWATAAGQGSISMTDDADGNGLTALLEYAYGAAVPGSISRTLLPANSTTNSGGTNYLVLNYFARTSGVTVMPEVNTTLATNGWGTNGISSTVVGTVTTNNTTLQQRRATVPVDGTRKFLRLKATSP